MISPSGLCEPLVLDPAYTRLKEHLIDSTGLAYYSDKDTDLADRISRRLSKVGLTDCKSYLNLLTDGKNGDVELDELIAELTIGETYFFRYREQFEALRTSVIPDIIARNQASRRLRIWSAGCATGAEAYSIAILLKRELSDQLAGWDVNIIGTDINRTFLARARAGKFDKWALRSTPDEVKRACFQQVEDSWAVRPEYKEWVGFQYHNLVKHPFPSLVNNLCFFDLILCRNTMIYFSSEIMRRLIAQFHQSLVEGGWLLVGHSEPNSEQFGCLRAVAAPGTTLYQKSVGSTGTHDAIEVDWRAPTFLEGDLLAASTSAAVPAFGPTTGEAPAPVDNLNTLASLQLSDVRSLADRGQWENAAGCCRKLLDTDALNPEVHLYFALVLEQMGMHADAEQMLRRAVYLDRSFVLAHYYLGLILQKKADLRGAQRAFENVRALARTMDAGRTFEDADNITAGDLMSLTETHLEVLRRS